MAYVTWPTFIIFVPPTISMGWLNTQTSRDLVHRLTTRGTIQKMQKFGQDGAWTRSCDLFLNFAITSVSLERIKLETSNMVCPQTNKCKSRSKGMWPMSLDLLI